MNTSVKLHQIWSACELNDDEELTDDENDATRCPNERASMFLWRAHTSEAKRTLVKKSGLDNCMMWHNDFGMVDGRPATGVELFNLYIMMSVKSEDLNQTSNSIITLTMIHMMRAIKTGQISSKQHLELLDVVHDYRSKTPAREMVKYITRVCRSHPLMVARMFQALRTLSLSAASAYLHSLLCSCNVDTSSLSLQLIMKVCSVVLKCESLNNVLEWIRTTSRSPELQTVTFSKLCAALVFNTAIHNSLRPHKHEDTEMWNNIFHRIEEHYYQDTNMAPHLSVLSAHEFPFYDLILIESDQWHKRAFYSVDTFMHSMTRLKRWLNAHNNSKDECMKTAWQESKRRVDRVFVRIRDKMSKGRCNALDSLNHLNHIEVDEVDVL